MSANFSENLSAMQKQEFKRWLKISVLLLLGLLFILVILQVRQMTQLETLQERIQGLQKKTQSINALLEQKGTYKQELQNLQAHLYKINKHKNNPKNPVSTLTHLSTLLSDTIQLQSLELGKKTVTLQVHCKTAHEATTFAHKMEQLSDFEHIKLSSISPQSDGFMFRINGYIHK